MDRKINVIEDLDGKKTVFVHDILFKGKRSVNWDNVERYLRQYVGEFYDDVRILSETVLVAGVPHVPYCQGFYRFDEGNNIHILKKKRNRL